MADRPTPTWLTWLAFAAVLIVGCRSGQKVAEGLPSRYATRRDGFVVRSNFEVSGDHPFVEELERTRETVTATLQLPPQRVPVDVYIFGDEQEYRRYMGSAYPRLPVRRAYFIGTPRELAIFAYASDQLDDDLRHEFTHGLLHASLGEVPLWIDEGLAEYFEVPGPTGTANSDYVRRLSMATANGWRPDVRRLERLEAVHQMQRVDYQEAWAWTHYMLHGPEPLRPVLLDYLADLRLGRGGGSLSERIKDALPDAESRMMNHVASLATGATWASAESRPHHD